MAAGAGAEDDDPAASLAANQAASSGGDQGHCCPSLNSLAWPEVFNEWWGGGRGPGGVGQGSLAGGWGGVGVGSGQEGYQGGGHLQDGAPGFGLLIGCSMCSRASHVIPVGQQVVGSLHSSSSPSPS